MNGYRNCGTMECYSTIRRNKSESVLVRWTNLETGTQSEISREEENKYHVLTHIRGIQKNGTDKPICKAGTETQTLRTGL